jgi:hypothetical protein
MKFTRFALLAAAALFVAACLPVTTKNPVGSTAGFKGDPALIGVWKGRSDEKKDFYIAFLNGRDGTMTALMFSPGEENGEWDAYTLQVTNLGENHILNARFAPKNGGEVTADEAKLTFPVLYQIRKNGSLALTLLDENKVKAAIRSGEIEGVIDPGDSGDAHITADPKQLDAFFATKKVKALFAKSFAAMHRVD